VKQLGKPSLDPLTVLVREAAQNSWDARTGAGPIDFRVGIRTLGQRAEAWRRVLLPGPQPASKLDVSAAISEDTLLLMVSDRNTVGLGGPLRAGTRQAEGDDKPNFVQFLRNVGEPSLHEFGGGTYGFGKGIFYRLSRVGTVLVDTSTERRGPGSRRLMVAAMGHSWFAEDRQYTGRHWWGAVGADGIPDPLLDDDADQVAHALGLPGFADGRSGTDIAVLAADLGSDTTVFENGGRTPQEASTYLASAMLWHLWPKMIPDAEGRYMRCVAAAEGRDVPVPSPDTLDEFRPFVEALRRVRNREGRAFSRTVPPKDVGMLDIQLTGASTRPSRLLETAAKPFEGPLHHVARMRVPELVVDYFPGPAHPDARLGYAGVFKSSELADVHFAAAEPPTHDSWVTKGLTGTTRGVVHGAKAFILKEIDERLNLGTHGVGTGIGGLGMLASRLASMTGAPPADSSGGDSVDGTPGTGATTGNGGAGSSAGGASTGRPGRAKILGSPVVRVHDGQPFVAARVQVPASTVARTVGAEVSVVVEGGGREIEPPVGAETPVILQWRSTLSDQIVHGSTLVLPSGDPAEWWVYSTYVPDAVLRFRLQAGT
jgi:hypothetical protein